MAFLGPDKQETISSYWLSFFTETMSKEASQEQIDDMKAAFYAGAFSHMMISQDIAVMILRGDQAGAIERAKKLEKEIRDFIAQLPPGR